MSGGQVIARIRTVWGSRKALLALSAVVVPAAILGTASAASADDVAPAVRFAVGSPAMQAAQSIALANWGTDACGGQVDIQWGTDDPTINARSYWANPVSSYDDPADNVQCRIVLNAAMTFTWPKFCTVLVHEYGHLTGHPHTVDGPDVMSPIYRAPLPACTAADPSAPAVVPAAPTGAASSAAPTSAALAVPVTKTAKPTRARIARHRSHALSQATVEPLPWLPFTHTA